MTRALLRTRALMLSGLLICSTACTKTVQVPVPVVPVACPLDPFPSFPAPNAAPCGDQVCLTPPAAAAIWKWARDVQRWGDMALACLDARS